MLAVLLSVQPWLLPSVRKRCVCYTALLVLTTRKFEAALLTVVHNKISPTAAVTCGSSEGLLAARFKRFERANPLQIPV